MYDVTFSEQQKKLILDFKNDELKRINLLVGSVRSGKTWISLIIWLMLLSVYPIDGTYLMCAKTLTSLKRNCLDLLYQLYPDIKYSISKKECKILGRTIYLEGASDARAEQKIRGLTLNGAYIDECTLIGEDFFTMLLSRLSVKNAKLIATTNPDTPYHWLYKNFISNQDKLSMNLYDFKIEDNISLDKKYIEALKQEYSGVYYDRYILGKWTVAEGIIYRTFAEHNEKYIFDETDDLLALITIGIDYGASKSKTTFIATGFTPGYKKIYVLKEQTITGIYEPDMLYKKFDEFFHDIVIEYGTPKFVFADYGALGQIITRGLRAYCFKYGINIQTHDCNKGTINDRIQLTNKLFSQNRIKINKNCVNLITAFNNAVWQSNIADTRLDNGTVGIDYLDAFEYSIYSFYKYI